MIVTLATSNIHKVEEINLIARDYNVEFVLPKGDFNPVEDSDNFLGNATCKVLQAVKSGNSELYLADDSGLCVDALNGEPGVYSARYEATPDKRIDKLLKNMEGVKDRSARFVCAMVIANKKGEILYKTQGECEGYIMLERKGSNGFGYDPIFFVNKYQKGMAQLLPEEKAKVSHRSVALNNVLNWLKNEYYN